MAEARIHFEETQKNHVALSVLLLSLFLLVVGWLKLLPMLGDETHKWLIVLGFALQVWYYLRLYLYRHAVQWNNKGINIRVNSYLGFNINFAKIKALELSGHQLFITKTDGSTSKVSLRGVNPEDVARLEQILRSHIKV